MKRHYSAALSAFNVLRGELKKAITKTLAVTNRSAKVTSFKVDV